MSPAAAAIVEAVGALGIELRVVGADRLQARPLDAVPEDLFAAMRRHRREVVEAVRQANDYRYRERQAVGQSQPPAPHRRCRSCPGGLHPDDPDGGPCFTCRWPGMPTRVQ